VLAKEDIKLGVNMEVDALTLNFPNGIQVQAPYGNSNLPILQLDTSTDDNFIWKRCFRYENCRETITESAHTMSVFLTDNKNLPTIQKELLLWHTRLSHASIETIHNICHHKRPIK
jgi:hypothetical protein